MNEFAYRIQGNPSQQEAIRHFRGPCEVIAGPGSGKTFVLVERILFLLLVRRIPPSQILVLTFSTAAARQMQDRFRKRIGEYRPAVGAEVTFGTFHSVFLHLLQSSRRRSVQLIDTDRSRRLLQTLLLRYHPDAASVRSEDVTDLSSRISLFKSGAGASPSPSLSPVDPSFPLLLADYQQYLRENSLLDFDDIISECVLLLREEPKVRELWQKRFPFLLVDEFQDINREQFEGIRLLCGTAGNLFVVGDDDQSIYGFRGSDPRIMIHFPEYYSGTHMVRLSVNYRSLKPIADCSQKIIRENKLRIAKKPIAARADKTSSCIRLCPHASEAEEYAALCLHLREMTPAQRADAAVIFRGHHQMQRAIRALTEGQVPYRLLRAAASDRNSQEDPRRNAASFSSEYRKLLQEAEDLQQALLAYYRLSCGLMQDRLLRRDLFRILNVPERFLLRSKFTHPVYTRNELCRVYPENSKEAEALAVLCRDLMTLQRLQPAHSCRFLLGKLPCSAPIGAEILRLAQASSTPVSFVRTLQSLPPGALLPKAPGPPSPSEAAEQEKGVLLLTMHSSKGLEFGTVFLPDLNEGIFPVRSARDTDAIEEERRLFYVAVTRARDALYLLYVKGTRQNPRRPSRFLEPLGVKPWE